MRQLSPHLCLVLGLMLPSIGHAQESVMPMSMVPYGAADSHTQQPNGPSYSFKMATSEVTVSQYIAFLNDAEANQGNARGANLTFYSNGHVGLPAELRRPRKTGRF